MRYRETENGERQFGRCRSPDCPTCAPTWATESISTIAHSIKVAQALGEVSRAVCLTLTLPSGIDTRHGHTFEELYRYEQRAWRNFSHRFQDAYGYRPYFIRFREPQFKRGSIAPHVILLNAPEDWPADADRKSPRWKDIDARYALWKPRPGRKPGPHYGRRNSLDVLRDPAALGAYVTDYVAKQVDSGGALAWQLPRNGRRFSASPGLLVPRDAWRWRYRELARSNAVMRDIAAREAAETRTYVDLDALRLTSRDAEDKAVHVAVATSSNLDGSPGETTEFLECSPRHRWWRDPLYALVRARKRTRSRDEAEPVEWQKAYSEAEYRALEDEAANRRDHGRSLLMLPEWFETHAGIESGRGLVTVKRPDRGGS